MMSRPRPPVRRPISLAASVPPQKVVGGDESGVLLALEGRVEDDRGDAGPAGLGHRPHQGPVVERGEDQGVDAGAGQGLDDLDLLVAVVLLERALPDDLDAELPGGGERSGMDGFPELVGRADGDDGDPQRPAARAVAAPGRPAGRGGEDGQSDDRAGDEREDSGSRGHRSAT